jgi:hypothetical protein
MCGKATTLGKTHQNTNTKAITFPKDNLQHAHMTDVMSL